VADSDFLRESGYGSWLVTGGDVPDDWGDCGEKKAYVRKRQTGGDVPDDSWMERLWAWADKNNIKEKWLPRDKSGVINLQKLMFSHNYLTELPKEIGQLTNLQSLRIGGRNLLTKLPKEIGQLTNLQSLVIGGNMGGINLTELPKEIGQLTNLQILKLGGNKLTDIPKELWCASTKEILGHLKSKLKVQKNSKAEIINICAVNKRGSTSKPIKIYRTDKDVKLPEQFVLRLDSAADLPSGSEALKISNYKLKLIGTHKKAYLEDILKGFRRRVEGDTFILVNLQTENMTP
jgi:hypothetical protein